MPIIGLIRGVGEGEIATGHLIKLGKALNRRFRSGIKFEELAVGNCIKYGYELTGEAIESMRKYECIFSGDMSSTANVLNYSICDIALSLSNDTEYTSVSGFGDYAPVDIHIVNYFDGNSKLRYSEN
ncbi:MAG: hypothetical protein IJ297_01125, partial [Clostridia bacterium]|nr:hypothetical protein [Clostridia bacterium]